MGLALQLYFPPSNTRDGLTWRGKVARYEYDEHLDESVSVEWPGSNVGKILQLHMLLQPRRPQLFWQWIKWTLTD